MNGEPTAASSPGTSDALDALFVGAFQLLSRDTHLEAVHILHAEIARRLGDDYRNRLPTRYASRTEARRQHAILLSQRAGLVVPSSKGWTLAGLTGAPAWAVRATLAIVVVGLTLRYAWAVSNPRMWARQHPEGNWISRFYSNAEFQGFPLVRYDVGVNSDFGAGGAADSMPSDGFSARWDTCLIVAREVAVDLQLESDDWSKLLLDGESQFGIDPGPGQASMRISIAPGMRHLRVEFVERSGMALIRLNGLELAGTDDYQFARPKLAGTEVTCR